METLGCYININRIASAVHYRGKALAEFDAVIPRIGSGITEYGTALVRQFELTKAFCLNSGRAISNSRNKLLAHQIMAENQLPMPITAFASSPHSTDDLIDMVGGPPLVVKLLQSTQGRGVVLADTKKGRRVDHRCLPKRRGQFPGSAIHCGRGGSGHPLYRSG